MQTRILIIDTVKKHREVVKSFLNQSQPDTELVELDPSTDTIDNLNWGNYYLLIIDSQLGDQSGIDWVSHHKDENNFPPFIFLSSCIDPNSLEASIQADQGMKLGAETFLFKQQLRSDKLNYYIKNALEKSGAYMPLEIEDDMFNDPDDIDDAEEISLGDSLEDTGDYSEAVESTYHQMWYAKALLQGYEHWPFKIQDMLNGSVNIGGYSIDGYLGCRDRIFSFSGHHTKDDKPYAIKLIDRSTTLGRKPPDKLKTDLQALIANKNPNLVKWIAFHAIEDYVIMVQEYLVGKKLSKLLHKTGVTEEQAINFMLQILSGLEVLHENGMTAGAFGPDNLLFRSPKTLVHTHLNNVYYPLDNKEEKGIKFNYQEALYLSPEAIQNRTTDQRSDLYVAGTIFYHMLAGKPPFHSKRTQDVLTEHIASPLPDLPDKHNPLNEVIRGLMAKTPSQRIQTAEDARNSINRITGS